MHKRFEEEDYARIAEHFFDALNANGDLEILQSYLAKFLLAMAHASLLVRGQAAVIEWMLQLLANVNGYQLSYSKEWSGGEKHLQPEQQALSSFDVVNFTEDFKKNVILTPAV